MKKICDDHSSRLTQEHLNCLMHISLHKEELGEHDYEKILNIWKDKKKQRGSKAASNRFLDSDMYDSE